MFKIEKGTKTHKTPWLHGWVNINTGVISVFWFSSYYQGFFFPFRKKKKIIAITSDYFFIVRTSAHKAPPVTKSVLLNHSSLRKHKQRINVAVKWLFVMSALMKKSQTSKENNASVAFRHYAPNVEMFTHYSYFFFFFKGLNLLKDQNYKHIWWINDNKLKLNYITVDIIRNLFQIISAFCRYWCTLQNKPYV